MLFVVCNYHYVRLYCELMCYFFFQAEDGIRDLVRSRGLGDVYKRQVCTRIELGWSDCVGLSSPDLAAVPVAAYIDPTNPRVETFLVDESANLQAPISQLAAIDVPLELLGTVGDGRTAQLSLELPIGSSVAAVMDRPESGVEGASIVAKATGS